MNYYQSIMAAERRQEREAQKHQRELERRAKDQAKLSALEQARLEVETHENQLEVILSVHKQQGETWDWFALMADLCPVPPKKGCHHEFNAKQKLEVSLLKHDRNDVIDRARYRDEEDFQNALSTYAEKKSEWDKMKNLACRILVGEREAYLEALAELGPFGEISNVGSSINFSFHSAKILKAELKANGRKAIPSVAKTLTATGKVSVKPMPKVHFQEIYQDYICACVLRIAREVFALLPVDTFLITASVDELDPRSGHIVEQPVLSAAIPRADVLRLNYERLDPSNAMENFLHRGELKASRKTGAFESIIPLAVADLPQTPHETLNLSLIIERARQLREELKSEIMTFNSSPNLVAAPVPESV